MGSMRGFSQQPFSHQQLFLDAGGCLNCEGACFGFRNFRIKQWGVIQQPLPSEQLFLAFRRPLGLSGRQGAPSCLWGAGPGVTRGGTRRSRSTPTPGTRSSSASTASRIPPSPPAFDLFSLPL